MIRIIETVCENYIHRLTITVGENLCEYDDVKEEFIPLRKKEA